MNNALPTDYQNFIATSRYARWLEEEGRRETWTETVTRYVFGLIIQLLDRVIFIYIHQQFSTFFC